MKMISLFLVFGNLFHINELLIKCSFYEVNQNKSMFLIDFFDFLEVHLKSNIFQITFLSIISFLAIQSGINITKATNCCQFKKKNTYRYDKYT